MKCKQLESVASVREIQSMRRYKNTFYYRQCVSVFMLDRVCWLINDLFDFHSNKRFIVWIHAWGWFAKFNESTCSDNSLSNQVNVREYIRSITCEAKLSIENMQSEYDFDHSLRKIFSFADFRSFRQLYPSVIYIALWLFATIYNANKMFMSLFLP